MFTKELLEGTSFRGVVSARADASDPKALTEQIHALVKEMRDSQDAFEKETKAGFSDVVRKEEVDRINSEISAKIDELKAAQKEQTERMASLSLNGSPSKGGIQERAMAYSERLGRTVSVDEYKAYEGAMDQFLRKGPSNADPDALKVLSAMKIGSDPDGGYSVTNDMSGRIVERLFETSPMRQVASVVSIGTTALEGFTDLNRAGAEWTGETDAPSETGTPKLGKYEIPVHNLSAKPAVSNNLLADSELPLESWLATKVADEFALSENAAFLVGNGVKKPRGLLTYATSATSDKDGRAWETFQHTLTNIGGGFPGFDAGDVLIDVAFSLKAAYRNNASWMMNRATVAAVRKLKDNDGNYLWQPDFTKQQAGTLLGYPIVESEDMPDIAIDSLSIAFGDFRETYTIVDRQGITVLRDPYTNKPYTLFYTTKRVGGGAVNFDSMKFLKFGS